MFSVVIKETSSLPLCIIASSSRSCHPGKRPDGQHVAVYYSYSRSRRLCYPSMRRHVSDGDINFYQTSYYLGTQLRTKPPTSRLPSPMPSYIKVGNRYPCGKPISCKAFAYSLPSSSLSAIHHSTTRSSRLQCGMRSLVDPPETRLEVK